MPTMLRRGMRTLPRSLYLAASLSLLIWLVAGALDATAQGAAPLTPGFASKHLVVAGSCPICPRDPPFYVVRQALAPDGYAVTICELVCAQTNGAKYVAAGTDVPGYGPIDLGVVAATDTRWAYEGVVSYADEPPHKNLRVIAYIENPHWLVVAVKSSSGITDLHQIAEQHMPVTLSGGTGALFNTFWRYYGFQDAADAAATIATYGPGAGFVQDLTDDKSPDVVIQFSYLAANAEVSEMYYASIKEQLEFLPIPSDLVQAMANVLPNTFPGTMPAGEFNNQGIAAGGVGAPTGDYPTLSRPGHVVYGRSDMPEDFAYLLAKRLDENRWLFRQQHLAFSYDPNTVAADIGVPIHPGALRYYKEKNYPICQPLAMLESQPFVAPMPPAANSVCPTG
jgi:uncharacterized protein